MIFNFKRKLILVFVFAIAMGFLESVVVVYLRYMFYQSGFKFPMTVIPNSILNAELVRELCTIVMIVAVSWLAGKNRTQRFSYFLFSFAVWDILYYIGLKLFLDWPQSFFTWDILFLIPVPWVGPVLAPVICSVTMIILSIIMLYGEPNNIKLKKREWILIYLGALIIFISFVWDYSGMILSGKLNSESISQITSTYIPQYYRWDFFTIGMLIIWIALILMISRIRRSSFSKNKSEM